jgi:hypothetical protein
MMQGIPLACSGGAILAVASPTSSCLGFTDRAELSSTSYDQTALLGLLAVADIVAPDAQTIAAIAEYIQVLDIYHNVYIDMVETSKIMQ